MRWPSLVSSRFRPPATPSLWPASAVSTRSIVAMTFSARSPRRQTSFRNREKNFSRKSDLASLVDFNHLYFNFIAFFEVIQNIMDPLMGDFRDVKQSVLVGQN